MLDDVTSLDIERDGLDHTPGLASTSIERKAKHQDYLKHLERMNIDEEYRERWLQNERDLQESIKRGIYY